jgi:hypothetical protein
MLDTGLAAPAWEQLNLAKSGTGTIKLRIRTANTIANLKRATWVGSDGTKNTSYSDQGWQTIVTDPAATGRQWMQWKATFTGSGAATPILEDVLFLYQ